MTYSKSDAVYFDIIKRMHQRWVPHEGEVKVLRAVFNEPFDIVFVQCGRKFGKTETAIYLLYRWGLLHPHHNCYYFSPFLKQTREILWANNRLQGFLPWAIDRKNDSEMRVRLKNGSFIKADGADNEEGSRGITPNIVVYDEFRDFKRRFHRAMGPNLLAKKAKLVIFTTPPEVDGMCSEVAEMTKTSDRCAFFHMTSYENPYNDRQWLDNEKETLYARGEWDVWEREYMARDIRGGANSIFPMFDRKKIVKPHDEVIELIRKDRHKLSWFVTADPGTTTVFAVLVAALNPYTKMWYWLDVIYETDQAKTSVNEVWPRIDEIRKDLLPPMEGWDYKWTHTYDEAAAWFQTEMQDRFNVYFQPTQKAYNKKDQGLSLIKDILLQGKVVASDRCEKLFWEIENYIKDDRGNIPKKNDHLIDCVRYTNGAAYYSLNEEQDPKDKDERVYRRGYSLEEEFSEFFGDRDDLDASDLFQDSITVE